MEGFVLQSVPLLTGVAGGGVVLQSVPLLAGVAGRGVCLTVCSIANRGGR